MKTIAVDFNPATREVATGTEVYTREVGSRLPTAAPEFRWLFYASRARPGLGVDVMVVPMARLWSQVRLPLALQPAHPDLLFVPHGGGEQVDREVAPPSRLAELGLDGSFVLQVGRIEKRKNQVAALAAVERLDGVTLAVAGPERDGALAARLRASSHCRVLGRVDRPTLETAIGARKVRTLLVKAAKARAAEFTWDRSAAGVANVVHELLD